MASMRPSKRPRARTEDEASVYDEAVRTNLGRSKRARNSEVTEYSDREDVRSDASSELDLQRLRDGVTVDYETHRDAGFEDDQNEAADDLRATQIVTRRFRETTKNAAAENAIIEEIKCTNFMCHEKLVVSLGPLINFIIGHNGSGKSAVLTAITLCLGGKATATNRGQSLKSFIKEGRDVATLSIRLKNQGTSAFKPDVYGRSITIERYFSQKGTSGYTIKDENGKKVSTKKSDLEDITDAFALQLDNPMNVLTQDMARQFLSDSTSKDKYNFFVKGTQLQTLDRDYALLSEGIDQIEAALNVKRDDLAYYQKARREAKRKAERADSLEGLKRKETDLSKQYAWARVEEEEQRLDQYDEALRKADETIQEMQAAADNAASEYDEAHNAAIEAEQSLETKRSAAGSKVEARDEVKTAFDENKKSLTRALGDLRIIQGKIKAGSKEIKTWNDKIEEEHQRQANADDGQHAQKLADLQEAKAAKANAQTTLQSHAEEVPLHQKRSSEAKFELDRRQQACYEKRNQVQASQRSLQMLSNSQRSWMDPYNPNLSTLLRAIEREPRFREKPVGPMGRHVQLLKSEWSSILEKSFGTNLDGFVVTSKADQNLLSGLMQKTKCVSPIFIGKADPIDTSDHEPSSELTTWARVLQINNDLVRNTMIINQRIEQVILIKSRKDGYSFMQEQQKLGARGHRICYTMQDVDQRRGHFIQLTGAGALRMDPIDAWNKAPRMQTDSESQVNAERANLARLQQELQQAQQAVSEAQTKLSDCGRAIEMHQKRGKELKLGSQTASERVEQLQEEIDNDTPQDGIIDELEVQLKQAQDEKSLLESQYQDAVNAKDRIDEKSRDLRAKLSELDAELRRLNEELSMVQEDLVELQNRRQHALRNKNDSLEEIGNAERDKVRLGEEREEQARVVEQIEIQAAAICPRVVVPENESAASLEKKYRKTQKERERGEAELGGTHDQLWQRAHAARADHIAAREVVERLDQIAQTLKSSLLDRLTRWRLFRRHISSRARITFGYLLSERNFRGHLQISHTEKHLDIQVEPDITKTSDTGRQTKTLSGGEKSFSTICLLLALWDAMGSPIRCLDEFDVFMDNVNRDISMKMMIGAARRAVGRQYILITPQAMGNVPLEEDVKIIKMRDPERGQTTLPFGS